MLVIRSFPADSMFAQHNKFVIHCNRTEIYQMVFALGYKGPCVYRTNKGASFTLLPAEI
jgi:hypothetical protein